MNLESYCIPRRHRIFGQTTKHPLNNFVLQKPGKLINFEGWRLPLFAYEK